MKPYYEEAGITIYHGDSREIIPSVDAAVLITDPPYNVDFGGKNTKHTARSDEGYVSGDSSIGVEVVTMALPVVKRAGIFPGTRMLFQYPEPYDIGCVYCPSGAGIGRWGWICMHPVLFYGARPTMGAYPSSITSFETAEPNGHPCPKPLGWMKWLIKLATLDGETILEPFMGSGTTLVAAKDLGFSAIGIELEEKYCEIAANRLRQSVFNFEPVESGTP
jgi:site-specific DNA-methyltransferase (adenine-specific)